MTIPRSEQINLDETPYYHCMSRCVRGAYLCGQDQNTTKNFAHRKSWVLSRLRFLSEIFAIKICAYAIMSNHYHLVLYVDKAFVDVLTESEVCEFWEKLFPKDVEKHKKNNTLTRKKLKQWRANLYSISLFMACLNEFIARKANQEDDCKGRFWEGRFKSQALLDDGAVLSAMAYVDLNPIRANLAMTPEDSDFTSIQARIKQYQTGLDTQHQENSSKQPATEMQNDFLMPLSSSEDDKNSVPFNIVDYFMLVEETGRVMREDKAGFISSNIRPLFDRLSLLPSGWLRLVKQLQKGYAYAVGNSQHLSKFTHPFLKGSPKGICLSNCCYQSN